MSIGVNLTSPITSDAALALLRAGEADFVEILIDNFLHLSPDTLREAVGDVPIAFHIMNSRFLENDEATLSLMAKRLRTLIQEVQPLYVSDHVGAFSHGRRRLPMVMELDYDRDLPRTVARVAWWQEALGERVHLENYPSTFGGGEAQVVFYEDLLNRTGCGLLFDISNAMVAELNGALSAGAWLPLAGRAEHFHIAGYMQEDSIPPVTVDAHDGSVSERSLDFARRVRQVLPPGLTATVTVERDANFSHASWLADLEAVRRVFAG